MPVPWETPHICVGCEKDGTDECKGEYLKCIQDAHDTADDRKYHEQREERD
jgi:hypothetical protein